MSSYLRSNTPISMLFTKGSEKCNVPRSTISSLVIPRIHNRRETIQDPVYLCNPYSNPRHSRSSVMAPLGVGALPISASKFACLLPSLSRYTRFPPLFFLSAWSCSTRESSHNCRLVLFHDFPHRTAHGRLDHFQLDSRVLGLTCRRRTAGWLVTYYAETLRDGRIGIRAAFPLAAASLPKFP